MTAMCINGHNPNEVITSNQRNKQIAYAQFTLILLPAYID